MLKVFSVCIKKGVYGDEEYIEIYAKNGIEMMKKALKKIKKKGKKWYIKKVCVENYRWLNISIIKL